MAQFSYSVLIIVVLYMVTGYYRKTVAIRKLNCSFSVVTLKEHFCKLQVLSGFGSQALEVGLKQFKNVISASKYDEHFSLFWDNIE